MIPVLEMLRADHQGPFGPLLDLVTGPDGKPVETAYFWLTGAYRAFSTMPRPISSSSIWPAAIRKS